MYNRAILIGNLTRDPELRYKPQGKAVASFGLAVNTKYGDKDEVLFIDIVVWGKQGEASANYLGKGSRALVEGRLSERKWEGKDGQQHKKMELIADNVRFLSRKGEGGGSAAAPESAPDEITDIEAF
jgi:single-strand DNA-binding protein